MDENLLAVVFAALPHKNLPPTILVAADGSQPTSSRSRVQVPTFVLLVISKSRRMKKYAISI